MKALTSGKRLWLLSALAVSLLILGRAVLKVQAQSVNRLAVGQAAKVSSPVYLSVNPPSALNFLSKQEVLDRRRQYLYQHPELLCYQYLPTAAVFDAIEDGKPWWGMRGQIFYGPGMRSIEGDGEESRFLNNPFLLVQANLIMEKFAFDENQFSSQEELSNTAMPLECPPASAVFYARERREEIGYDVSAFLRATENATRASQPVPSAKLDLVAYNARDLGYNWLCLSSTDSNNLMKVGSLVAIDQYIHSGPSCGYPGGCNNMSPYNDKLFDIGLKALPARGVVKLWHNMPRSPSDPADFTVQLFFK